MDTLGLDDVVSLEDLGITPNNIDGFSMDEQNIAEREADENFLDFLSRHPEAHGDLPSSDNVWDYFSDKDRVLREGRIWREEAFFQLRDKEQRDFAKYFNEFRDDLSKRGFNTDDPEILDLCNSLAGDKVVREINALGPGSTVYRYYHSSLLQQAVKKFMNDPRLTHTVDIAEDWFDLEDFDDFGDDFTDFFDDLFGF